MDNFILYDDLCKTEHSIIYKGRRKGSINFVAIHCIEKALRPEITNLVRLTYEMNHKNVVKFYEWYETSNHLWLVVELCTAGTLESILDQDQCLPESSIKKFGIDLCEGLNYIHSLGILFCDLIPRKLMIDGEGNLKLSDFGLAKAEGEDLEVVFQETTENTSSQWSQSVTDGKKPKKYVKPFGEVSYMAPEVLLGEENTQSSDLWSLGCILYKMYTGSCPFVAEDDDHLRSMIINKELPNPKGNKLSTKPSIEFLSLLKGLLDKDPTKRLTWRQLINHPFWENKLNALVQLKSMFIDGKEQFNEGAENDNEQDDRINHLNFSRISTDRPRTSTILDQKPEMNVSFSISSRLPTSPQSTMKTRNPVQCKESDVQSSTNTLVSQNFEKEEDFSDTQLENLNEYRRLFFLPRELNMSQIIDNPKIQKPSSLKYEPKVLPFNNSKFYKSETLIQMSKDEFIKSLELIKSNTNVPSDKSAGAIKLKLHLMNYIGTLCYESSKIADAFIQIELYKDLLAIIKTGHNLEMKMKAARIFAILFNRAKKLDTSKELTEILQSLIDIISANRKDLKFKQALLPALGEILYFISCQETVLKTSVENWSMPSLAYVLLVRNIGDDLITNHLICKIIQNIASTTSPNVKKFLNNPVEIVNALWSCYTNSGSNENLRISSLNALCMLSSHSINIFTTLVEKVGVDSILDCLTNNNSHIQLPILTMISMLSNETNSKNIPEKKLIPKLVHIYESTNILCRSKAYLLTFVLLKQQNDLLLTFSQSKLINSLERDNRKSFNVREENDYLHKIIDMMVDLIVNISSTIIDDNLSSLESVYGRKNPSANQIKLLKKALPNMSILKVLFLCQTFRTRVFDDKFIEKFSRLIKLSKPFNNGELNLDTICGPNSMADYIDSVISILEIIIQHNEIVKANSDKIVKYLLPQLMENIDLSNSDLRVESLKVLSEITNLFFNKQNDLVGQDFRGDLKFIIETQLFDIVDKLLVQPEPVPFFSLSIIESSLNFDITLINILKIRNILPNLIKLLQNYKNKVGSTLLLKLLNVVNLWSSTIDPMDLYENGIVDILKTIFNDISKSKRFDDRFVVDTLIDLLKIVDNLFKFVSEFVKKALQAKKVSGTNDSLAQQAEKLLHMNKPFVSLNPFLIHLFVNEDNDINELSTKIVWVIMQLFGSECKELLNQENLNLFLSATVSSNSKRQKIVLRIVKRIITADKQNLELFKSMGQNFIENMKILKNTANSEANVALSSMIDEILKLI